MARPTAPLSGLSGLPALHARPWGSAVGRPPAPSTSQDPATNHGPRRTYGVTH